MQGFFDKDYPKMMLINLFYSSKKYNNKFLRGILKIEYLIVKLFYISINKYIILNYYIFRT